MNGLTYKSLSFKAAGDGLQENEFSGYGSAFAPVVDDEGDIIQRGAFAATLPEFLESGLILWQHQMRVPIGKPLEAREDAHGLWLKARISDTATGRDCLTLMRDGVVRKMSIGFRIEAYSMLSEAQGRALLGDEAYDAAIKRLPWWSDGLRLITQIKLYEVSPVSIPANPEADILGVKSAGRLPETEREFERMLREAGFSRAAAVAVTNHGFKGLQRDAASDDAPAPAATPAAGDFDDLAASLQGLRAALAS